MREFEKEEVNEENVEAIATLLWMRDKEEEEEESLINVLEQFLKEGNKKETKSEEEEKTKEMNAIVIQIKKIILSRLLLPCLFRIVRWTEGQENSFPVQNTLRKILKLCQNELSGAATCIGKRKKERKKERKN